MRRLSVLPAFAGLVLGLACNDVTHLSNPAQFSKRIAFTDLQAILGQLPANGAARVKIELPMSGVIAREVKVKDPEEVNENERVESRITVLTVSSNQGTLTLEPGFKVTFTQDTKFAANGDLTFQQFVDQVNASLAKTPNQLLPVEAERAPASPLVLAPGDPFPAAKLELKDRVGGPELRLNITAVNLVATGSGDCKNSLSATLKGCLQVLGLTVGIDATTELEAMLPGVVETRFEGVVDCPTLNITSAHEGSFALVGQDTRIKISATTKIEFESGEDEQLADLNAVKAACGASPPQNVQAEGEGVPGTTAGTLQATEVEFELQEQAEAAEVEFTGAIEMITPPTLTVAGRTVVTDPATEIERDGVRLGLADLHVGDTVEVKGTVQSDGSVLAREIRPKT